MTTEESYPSDANPGPEAGGSIATAEEAAAQLAESREKILGELRRVIVGQDDAVEQLLVALFADGHCLFIGVPGLGKTLLVRTFAQCLRLKFARVQFTPDLMPSDITGTDILYQDPVTGVREFRFAAGPVFTNVLLADEINRAPPKTQSALLQAMQERQVTVGGRTYPLDLPFFVLATQNPIEQEGTYPLPEAQLDRFMFAVTMDYPSESEEIEIAALTTAGRLPDPTPVMGASEVLRLQRIVREVAVGETVLKYAARLVRMTRPKEPGVPGFVKQWVDWGAGPRATQTLVLAGKARALLHGRLAVSREDVRALALPSMRHRVIPSFAAEAEGITSDEIIKRVMEEVGQ
jgi:MoxR-like ATPase